MGGFSLGNQIVSAGESPWGYEGSKSSGLIGPFTPGDYCFSPVSGGYIYSPVLKGNAGTIEMWFRATSHFNYNHLFQDVSWSRYWEAWIPADGNPTARIYYGSTKLTCGVVAANTWHHYAFTWPSYSYFRVYIDGVLKGQGSSTSYTPSPGMYFNGNGSGALYLANIRVWEVERTMEEINNDMLIRYSKPKEGLLACYNLAQESGNILEDVVGGVGGVIKGTAAWATDIF